MLDANERRKEKTIEWERRRGSSLNDTGTSTYFHRAMQLSLRSPAFYDVLV